MGSGGKGGVGDEMNGGQSCIAEHLKHETQDLGLNSWH